MHESIERYVGAVLRDSGIPLERRREIGDEMRLHLHEAATARVRDGVCIGCAARDAIEAFGPAHALRRRLMLQQWRSDMSVACARLPLILPLGLVAGLAQFLAEVVVPGTRVGMLAAVSAGVVTAFSGWIAALAEIRIMRPRPRDETSRQRLTMRFSAAILAVATPLIALVVLLSENALSQRLRTDSSEFVEAFIAALAERAYAPVIVLGVFAGIGGWAMARIAWRRTIEHPDAASVEIA
ncbi:MAG: hypothetical protein ACKVS9_13645 [Phycisphaerae bacterium]